MNTLTLWVSIGLGLIAAGLLLALVNWWRGR